MKVNILLFVLINATIGFSQSLLQEEHYGDTLQGKLDYVASTIELDSGLIISGKNQINGSTWLPVIYRLNLNGEVVWSLIPDDSFQGYGVWFAINLFDDNYIYAVSNKTSFPNNFKYLWKINAINGEVEWVTQFYETYPTSVGVKDYDSTRFLMSYLTAQYTPCIAFIDKFNGDTLSVTQMSTGESSYASLGIDAYQNIFFSHDEYLYKFNGDDLGIAIWKQSYVDSANSIDVIHRIYYDSQGYVYVFGKSNSGTCVLAKVDPSDGSLIWKQYVGYQGGFQDYVDRFGYIFVTISHSYVGPVSNYTCTKVDKTTGSIIWSSVEQVTPLGSPSSSSGNGSSAISIDLDCDGNTYLNGYYGDANYGPEQWGIMKMDSIDGHKNYDLTITEDSLYFDDLSSGRGTAVFQNSPVFVGNLQLLGTYSTNGTFVTIEPNTGEVLIRHYIDGDYQNFSKTIDIQNSNDSVFILQQLGKQINLRMCTSFGIDEWQYSDTSSAYMEAGVLNSSANNVLIAYNRHDQDSITPYFMNTTNAIFIKKLNKETGVVLQNDSLIVNGVVRLLDIESDSTGQAFLLYSVDSIVFVIRLDAGGLSTPLQLGAASTNAFSDRPVNILDNHSSSELLYCSSQDLIAINKSSMANSVVYSYGSSRDVYDIINENGNVLIIGNTQTGYQSILSLDTTTYTQNWDQTYQSGTFGGATYYIDTIYAYGEANGEMQLQSIVGINGNPDWNYVRPNVSNSTAKAYNLGFSPGNETFVLLGTEEYQNGVKNLVMERVKLTGEGSTLVYEEDELGHHSYAYCSSIQYDSLLWIGGALNTISDGKQGVNYLVGMDSCVPTYHVDVVNECGFFTWIDGNTYTASNNTATWTMPNINGCDSIITLNLTITPLNLTVNYQPLANTITSNTMSATYQWLDCNNNFQPITGANSQSYSPSQNGSYAVEVTLGNCTDTSVCINVNTLNLYENFTDQVTIYPNPTKYGVTVNFEIKVNNVEIDVLDIYGKTVYRVEDALIKSTEIDMRKMSAGIYFVQIRSEQGMSIFKIEKL